MAAPEIFLAPQTQNAAEAPGSKYYNGDVE